MIRALYILILLTVISTAPTRASAGTSFDECQATAKTTREMGICQKAEYEVVRKDLEQKTAAARTEAEKIDADLYPQGHVAETLAKSEKEFKEYVAAQCDYKRATNGIGTGASDVYKGCEIQLMRQRIKMIK